MRLSETMTAMNVVVIADKMIVIAMNVAAILVMVIRIAMIVAVIDVIEMIITATATIVMDVIMIVAIGVRNTIDITGNTMVTTEAMAITVDMAAVSISVHTV